MLYPTSTSNGSLGLHSACVIRLGYIRYPDLDSYPQV